MMKLYLMTIIVDCCWYGSIVGTNVFWLVLPLESDAINDKEIESKVQRFKDEGILKVFTFSSVSGIGKNILLRDLFELVENKKNERAEKLGDNHQMEVKWKP